MSGPTRCKFHRKASSPPCGKPGRVFTVGCIHEHVYRTVLCPAHEDAPQRRCCDCWLEVPKVERHACELVVERAA